jgi:hypothetical protein
MDKRHRQAAEFFIMDRKKAALAFLAMAAVMTAMLVVVGFQIDKNRSLARQGHLAHDALCALNQRNINRIATSKQFLRDHPNGIPGVPVKLIRDGIKSDQSTVDILVRTLGDCSPPPP